ncbi:ABC transporter substrate-binding protein [Rhodococcus qingshengii]|uniref:ABC transporter substrate-binding protein n=1 Tax=Rhodococcus qingshengii TaxID=334542 RepID=UPI0036D88918
MPRSLAAPLLIALVAVFAVSACAVPGTTAAAASQEVKPGYLAVADTEKSSSGTMSMQLDYDSAEATGLDPQLAQAARSWSLMSLVYETLVTVGPDFTIQPRLAKAWDQPEPSTYVFHLREDVVFSNGRPMMADDVVGSLKRLAEGSGVWSSQIGEITSVTAPDTGTVEVKLAQPYSPFLAALANTPAAVLPMAEIEAGAIDLTKVMLGTGPFVVEAHRQDESWTFKPNSAYRDEKALGIDALNVEIVSSETTRLAGLREGSTIFANLNNADSLDLAVGDMNTRVVNQQQSDLYYLVLNSQRKTSPLADQEIRQAIASVLNRQQLADLALAGMAVPTNVTPAILPDACSPVEPASDAEEAAKGAIDVARGKKLDLLIYSSEPALSQLAQVVQQQLKVIGVDVTIKNLDMPTYNAKVFGSSPGDFDMAIGWFAGYADSSMLTKWWNPTTAIFSAGFIGNHEDLNSAIDEAASLAEGPDRTTALNEVCSLVEHYAEMLPLVTRPSLIGYRTDRLAPTLYANEGYGSVLRDIVDFRLLAEG